MAARRKTSKAEKQSRDHLRQLAKAGIVKASDFERKAGTRQLTRSAKARVDRIYDRVGVLISNPDGRPFHTYRPRSREKLNQVSNQLGLDVARLDGIRALPIPHPAGSVVKRVRVSKDRIDLSFSEGIVKRQRRIKFNKSDVEGQAARLEKRFPNASIQIRTRSGTYDPLEHGMSLAGALELLSSYNDSDDWLDGFEIIEGDFD